MPLPRLPRLPPLRVEQHLLGMSRFQRQLPRELPDRSLPLQALQLDPKRVVRLLRNSRGLLRRGELLCESLCLCDEVLDLTSTRGLGFLHLLESLRGGFDGEFGRETMDLDATLHGPSDKSWNGVESVGWGSRCV